MVVAEEALNDEFDARFEDEGYRSCRRLGLGLPPLAELPLEGAVVAEIVVELLAGFQPAVATGAIVSILASILWPYSKPENFAPPSVRLSDPNETVIAKQSRSLLRRLYRAVSPVVTAG